MYYIYRGHQKFKIYLDLLPWLEYNVFFRELGEQEALKKQNINRLENADETTKMIQDELDSYR